jgi:hypothetical protein
MRRALDYAPDPAGLAGPPLRRITPHPGNRLESPASRAAAQPAGVVRNDPHTNRPVLAIPLPESITVDRLKSAAAQLLGSLLKQG